MSRRLSAALIAVVLSIAALGAQQPQKFKVSTESVALYATVMDDAKRLVPDLVQEDFEVYDNGKLQTITQFDNKPLPITVVVMLDTSGSMTLSLDLVKQGAEEFLLRLLPDDRGMVGAFNDKIEFHPESDFSDNRDRLIGFLKELDFGYPTRLYDAVDESITKLQGVQGRKVIVVFTDGEDSESRVKGGDTINRARTEDVMVYAVGLINEYFNGQRKERTSPDHGLKNLAAETGGGFFLLKRTDELGPTFTRIAQELHSQYVLGFSPQTLDGRVHKLEVRVKKPGMVARTRKSYVAARGTNGH